MNMNIDLVKVIPIIINFIAAGSGIIIGWKGKMKADTKDAEKRALCDATITLKLQQLMEMITNIKTDIKTRLDDVEKSVDQKMIEAKEHIEIVNRDWKTATTKLEDSIAKQVDKAQFMNGELIRINESTKSAHKRIDDIGEIKKKNGG